MKIKSQWVIGFFLLFGIAITPAAEVPLNKIVKPQVLHFMRKQSVPGVAVVVYAQGNIYPYYFGFANKKHKIPVTGKTIFELGSITKTFTGLLLAQDVNRGQLSLNEKVSPYLPYGQLDTLSVKKINFLELATHTSALPFNAPDIPYNADATYLMKLRLQQFLRTWRAPYSPGTRSVYSNLGFGILGIALADRNRKSVPELMDQNILLPLHMSHSGLAISAADRKYYAQGYTARGRFGVSPQVGLLSGAWAMKSSIDDMQYYLKAALLTSDTPPEIRKAMRLSEISYYRVLGQKNYDTGLGWFSASLNRVPYSSLYNKKIHYRNIPTTIVKIDSPQFDSNTLIDKTGSTDGFRAYIGVLPKQQVGIVVLTNRFITDRWALPNMARKILFNVSSLNSKT